MRYDIRGMPIFVQISLEIDEIKATYVFIYLCLDDAEERNTLRIRFTIATANF